MCLQVVIPYLASLFKEVDAVAGLLGRKISFLIGDAVIAVQIIDLGVCRNGAEQRVVFLDTVVGDVAYASVTVEGHRHDAADVDDRVRLLDLQFLYQQSVVGGESVGVGPAELVHAEIDVDLAVLVEGHLVVQGSVCTVGALAAVGESCGNIDGGTIQQRLEVADSVEVEALDPRVTHEQRIREVTV